MTEINKETPPLKKRKVVDQPIILSNELPDSPKKIIDVESANKVITKVPRSWKIQYGWTNEHKKSIRRFIQKNIDFDVCRFKTNTRAVSHKKALFEKLPVENVEGIDKNKLPSFVGYSRVFKNIFDDVLNNHFASENHAGDSSSSSSSNSDSDNNNREFLKKKRKKRKRGKKKKKRSKKRKRTVADKKQHYAFKYQYNGSCIDLYDENIVKRFLENSINSIDDSDYSFKCNVKFNLREK